MSDSLVMGKGLRVGDVFNVDKGTSVDDLSNNEGALTLLSFQLGIPVNMNCVQQEDQLTEMVQEMKQFQVKLLSLQKTSLDCG